jgi:hypothetical protein
VYTGAGCTGKSYHYTGGGLGCDCTNISSPLNDKVHSFVFSGGNHAISIYKDAGCKGTELGEFSASIIV